MIKPKYQVVEDRPELIRDTYSKGYAGHTPINFKQSQWQLELQKQVIP